jgi:putative phosphoesterase
MKIGVISDTHISDKTQELPVKIKEAFKGVDMIIHVGDLVELSVLEKLRKICSDVRGVCGNMDPQEVRKTLREKEIITAGKYRIGVMHGIGAPVNLIDVTTEAFKNDRVDAIIFGHSHNGLNMVKNGILYFNPGSPTDKVYAKVNSVGIIEVNDKIEGRIIEI